MISWGKRTKSPLVMDWIEQIYKVLELKLFSGYQQVNQYTPKRAELVYHPWKRAGTTSLTSKILSLKISGILSTRLTIPVKSLAVAICLKGCLLFSIHVFHFSGDLNRRNDFLWLCPGHRAKIERTLRRSEDVLDILWTSYVRSFYVQCPGDSNFFFRYLKSKA